MSFTDISITSVPQEWAVPVARLRRYLNDTAELNDLLEVQESTDFELCIAIQDSFEEISYVTDPVSLNFANYTEVPWVILQQGALLNVLTMKGVLSARNSLTYNDSGGISVKDNDKYGRYINYFNILLGDFRRKASSFKKGYNIDRAYGGVDSEYGSQIWS